MNRLVDLLCGAFFLACFLMGALWMVMFSVDMVRQLMRVCQ